MKRGGDAITARVVSCSVAELKETLSDVLETSRDSQSQFVGLQSRCQLPVCEIVIA